MTTETDSPPLELQHSYHARQPDGWPRWVWRLVRVRRYRRLRKWATENGKDFEHRCCFWDQVRHIGRGIQDDWSAQSVEVPMRSGQTALYQLTKHDNQYGGTGQKIWRFQFQGYLSANIAHQPRP